MSRTGVFLRTIRHNERSIGRMNGDPYCHEEIFGAVRILMSTDNLEVYGICVQFG